jgi:hypothetical protein
MEFADAAASKAADPAAIPAHAAAFDKRVLPYGPDFLG